MPSFAIHTALSIPLAWGLYTLMFLQWIDLMLDLASPLATKSFKYPLVVSSHFDIQTTYSNLIQNWSHWFDIIFTISSDDYHSQHTSVNHQDNKNSPILASKSAAIEVSAGLWSSPPSWWRLLAGVLPRACTQESQPLSYGQWPRASCCRKRLPSNWGSSNSSEKIWFRFWLLPFHAQVLAHTHYPCHRHLVVLPNQSQLENLWHAHDSPHQWHIQNDDLQWTIQSDLSQHVQTEVHTNHKMKQQSHSCQSLLCWYWAQY